MSSSIKSVYICFIGAKENERKKKFKKKNIKNI